MKTGTAKSLLPCPNKLAAWSGRCITYPSPFPARRPTACELLKRCRLLGRRCAPWGVRLPARRGLQLSTPPRDASSKPLHTVPSPWPPLPPPGPRQVYKHQPWAHFPGSTCPSPSSSPPSSYIYFRALEPGRAGVARNGVSLRTPEAGCR